MTNFSLGNITSADAIAKANKTTVNGTISESKTNKMLDKIRSKKSDEPGLNKPCVFGKFNKEFDKTKSL